MCRRYNQHWAMLTDWNSCDFGKLSLESVEERLFTRHPGRD